MPSGWLAERTLRCQSGMFERTVWSLAPPAGAPTAAILFLDAELYLERVGAAAVVRRLQARGVIPPAVAVFLSAGGAAARHEDFVCRPEYARFVAGDLVGSVREEHPGVTEIVIAGLSLSGLATAYVATRHPVVFRAAACQSPSFWWQRGRFAQDLPPATPAGPKFWISVGSQETEAGLSHPPSGLWQGLTQVAGCLGTAAALRANGYRVSYREFDGGHDPEYWCDDLSLALPWALRRDRPPPAAVGPVTPPRHTPPLVSGLQQEAATCGLDPRRRILRRIRLVQSQLTGWLAGPARRFVMRSSLPDRVRVAPHGVATSLARRDAFP